MQAAVDGDPAVAVALTGLAADTGPEGADAGFVLRQVVTGCPPDGRVVGYQVELTDRTVRVSTELVGVPDIELRLDHAAAWAVFRGSTSAQTLLIEGALRVSGDLRGLGRRQAVFSAISDACSKIRAATTP
jgi:SCP-2 sterol transfer family